jgi:hypothetical protein
MTVNNEIKKALKEWLCWFAFFALICVAGTMDYNDAVLQHDVNCQSATFVNDNNLNCEGE